MTFLPKMYAAFTLLLLFAAAPMQGQRTQSAPATDSSAQASPSTAAPKASATDESSQASPIAPETRSRAIIPPHTTIRVALTEGIDSGKLKNGQTVRARLIADVPLLANGSSRGGKTIPAGTAASLTVIGTVPAGKINAVGELSLQLIQVGNQPVETEIVTFRGKPGDREVADAAPALGTNAGLPSGAPLTFHTQPSPHAAETQGPQSGDGPGGVNGVASGATPARNAPTGSTQPK